MATVKKLQRKVRIFLHAAVSRRWRGLPIENDKVEDVSAL